MKITSFNPLIVTTKQEEAQKVFEDLGFERTHKKISGVSQDINTVRMKDQNGNHVDISKVTELEKDMMIIRMNVDDLQQAFDVLTAHGFQPLDGSTSLTNTSLSALMVSPTGFGINIVKHLKD